MMFIIQDRHAARAARMVPDKLKFKQLLELCQLICSAGFSDIFTKINRGKEIQEWIKQNEYWTFLYGIILFNWCFDNIKMKDSTKEKFTKILNSIDRAGIGAPTPYIKDIVFRYKKDYNDTQYATNTILPVEEGENEYKRYVKWKIGGNNVL